MITDTDQSVEALRRTQCCGCGGKMPQRGPISLILLDKRADWSYPSHSDSFAPRSGTRAVSALCNYCVHEETFPKTAIEIRDDGTVIHHLVDALIDLPELAEGDLRDGDCPAPAESIPVARKGGIPALPIHPVDPNP